MKSKAFRDMMLFSIIGCLALGAMYFLTVRMAGNLPAYSVLNKSPQGFSVYFETLQELGLDAGQVIGSAEETPAGAAQILAYPWRFEPVEPQMMAWVREGGILVLAPPEPPMSLDEGRLISDKLGVRTWEVRKGWIITLPAGGLTNRTLTKDTVPSHVLTQELVALGVQSVRFNEQALFPEQGGPSLWKAVPLWLKLVIYQLLIAAGAWFWMKGNRLGAPLALEAETERTELEYLKAAAHFYQAAGCWRLMLDTYFKSLIRLTEAGRDNWLEIWRREGHPELSAAEALQDWMENIPPDCTAKEIQQQIVVIEHLKEIIRNRRHTP